MAAAKKARGSRNKELIKGVGRVSRSKMYHKRGLWTIKAKHGGSFPSHDPQPKPSLSTRGCPTSSTTATPAVSGTSTREPSTSRSTSRSHGGCAAMEKLKEEGVAALPSSAIDPGSGSGQQDRGSRSAVIRQVLSLRCYAFIVFRLAVFVSSVFWLPPFLHWSDREDLELWHSGGFTEDARPWRSSRRKGLPHCRHRLSIRAPAAGSRIAAVGLL